MNGVIASHTASDGYVWRYRLYAATGTPQAHVVCLHGIQSHGGWYEASCRRLAEAGYTVSFLDRRGSGLNEAARGDTPSFRRLLDDVAEYLHALRQTQATSGLSIPIFLLAISWGGKPAVALEQRHPGLVDGLALLCPGFCPRVGPSRKERGAILWARLTSPRRLFPVPLSDPALFTASTHWQKFIHEDPLAVRQATARFFLESVRLDGYLRWKARRTRLPILLLLAEQDHIIDNARTRAYVARFASADKEIHEYPGAGHTLEFEPNPEIFLGDLLGWLKRQTGQSHPAH